MKVKTDNKNSRVMLEGKEQRLTETFAYLGIHAGKAFVGTLQDPRLLHVNTRHCLGSDCENSKETVERHC